MPVTARTCQTCRWAELQYSPTGGIRNAPGTCTFKVIEPVRPECEKSDIRFRSIWPDDGGTCPSWETTCQK